MDPIKNLEEFDAAAGELEARRRDEVAKSEQRLAALSTQLGEKAATYELRMLGTVRHEAVGDIASVLASRVHMYPGAAEPCVLDDDGRPLRKLDDPRRMMTVGEYVRDYVRARPWLQTPAGEGAQASSGAGAWSLERALADLKYADEWKAKDPEGYAKAWADHLAKMDDDLRRSNLKR